MALEVPVPRDKSRGLQTVSAPGLALWLQDLDAEICHGRLLDSFRTKRLLRILRYRLYDMAHNQRLLEDAFLENILTVVLRGLLSMFGYVARLPAADHAHRILSCEGLPSWKRRPSQPLRTLLRRLD